MYTYCLFCETAKAHWVAKTIQQIADCRAICPKQVQHTWAKGGGARDVTRDLLPGYVFLYFKEQADVAALRSVQGVIRCLADTDGGYTLSGADELFALMLLEKDGAIGRTRVYQEGQTIRICDGAFEGVAARILKVERRLTRMLVEIPFDHRLVKTWVEYEIVKPNEEE